MSGTGTNGNKIEFRNIPKQLREFTVLKVNILKYWEKRTLGYSIHDTLGQMKKCRTLIHITLKNLKCQVDSESKCKNVEIESLSKITHTHTHP